MIGLRDRYTSRRHGERWLFVGDALSAGTAIPFVAGAFGADASLLDAIAIALWAILPRALGRVIDPLLKRPRTFTRNLSIAGSIGASLVILIGLGLALIEESATAGVSDPARSWWLLVVFASWGVGFFLFVPRIYLLHDLFLSGLIALGVAVGRPGAAVVLPLFFLGLALSGAMRHQLLDVFADIRRPRVNIVNPRRLAVVISAIVAIGFIGSRSGSGALFAVLGIEPRVVSQPTWISLPAPPGGPRLGALPSRDVFDAPPPNEGDGIVAGSIPTDRGEKNRIGFTRQVQLGNLSRTTTDPRIVLVAREGDERGRRRRTPSLRGDALWRGLTLCTFDPARESWIEEVLPPTEVPWSGDPIPHERERWIEGRSVLLDIAIVTPTMPTLPTPYFATWLLEPRTATAGYQRNVAGDVFPIGGVPPRTRYASYLVPRPIGEDAWPTTPLSGPHGSPRYDEIPTAAEVGFDLEGYARSIFGDATSIQDKIAALARHIRAEYRYDRDAGWVAIDGHLARFCLSERTGNCEYFATASALLLRAGGVSTRIVAGFLGWEWDRTEAQYVVRNGAAHLWLEAYFPGHGWFPVDATAWAPVAEGAVPTPATNGTGTPAAGPGEGDGSTAGEGPSPAPIGPDPMNPEGPAAPPRDIFDEGPDPALETEEEEALLPWLEEVPPPRTPGDVPPDAPGSDPDADGEADPLERLPGESEKDHEERLRRDRERRLARWVLLTIATSLVALAVLQMLRPARTTEEELDADLDLEAEESRGIPDPLAGWVPLPDDFEARTPDERVVAAYHGLQRALAERRRHRRPEETPREHGRRSTERLAPERAPTVEEDFRALVRIVDAALYAERSVTDEDAEHAERICRRLRGELR